MGVGMCTVEELSSGWVPFPRADDAPKGVCNKYCNDTRAIEWS
jgi:hypothetical protein